MLNRMVHAQRPQIGILMANGFKRRRVIWHYLSYGLILAVVGSVPGIIIGIILAREITKVYTSMLSIPLVIVEFYPSTIFIGISMGLISCLLAAWAPARGAVKVKPADAMRGETPITKGGLSLLEKFFPFLKRISSFWKIPLRGISRNKRRSIYTIVGIIFAMMLIMVSWGMLDTVNFILDKYVNFITLQDYHIQFSQPIAEINLEEIRDFDQVDLAEPVLELPVSIQKGDERYATALIGLNTKTRLHNFENEENKKISLPIKGIIVGRALRQELGVDRGDFVKIAVKGTDLKFKEKIVDFINEPIGTFAYISIDVAQNKLRKVTAQDDLITSSYLKVDSDPEGDLREKLSRRNDVGLVEDYRAYFQIIKKFMVLFYVFVGIMLALGGFMAFALIFNTMTVNIMERRREVATLRALGYLRRDILILITIENMLLTIIGIIPGLIAGYYISSYAMSQYTNDLFLFDLHFFPLTYVYVSVIILVVALISQIPGIKLVNRLDLTKIIKERTS